MKCPIDILMKIYIDMYMQLIMPETLKKELMPPMSIKELKQFILVRLPILSWLWSYQSKFLIGDITAGITVSIMHIPQGQWLVM